MEGEPRVSSAAENTVRKDGYCVQLGTHVHFFFRSDVLSVLPLLMNMATRGGNVQPARLVLYTPLSAGSVLCLMWFLSLSR